MNPIIRNVLAILLGVVIAMFVNGGIIQLSGNVFPPPNGVDPENIESINANMHLYEAKHFIFPFLAHALGTLAGAIAAALIAATHKMRFALAVGGLFLIAGIWVNILIHGPLWFLVLDIIGAYLPMGWLGGIIGERISGKK